MRTLIRWIFSFFGYYVFFVKPEERNSLEVNNHEQSVLSWANKKFHKGFEDKAYMKLYASICNKLKEHKIEIDNQKIVDVGCGSGVLVNWIYQQFNPSQIRGFDFAHSAIELAQKREIPNALFAVHDIYQPFIGEEKCDVLFCTEVLEHLEYPDKALLNSLTLLSANGVAFITVPNGRLDFWDGHVNFWSLSSWDIFVKRVLEIKQEKLIYKTGFLSEDRRVLYAVVKKANDSSL